MGGPLCQHPEACTAKGGAHCRACHCSAIAAPAKNNAELRLHLRQLAHAQFAEGYASARRDHGLKLAVASAGSISELARRMKVSRDRLRRLQTCPQGLVMEMARVTGLDPVDIRPDLAAWIEREKRKRLAHVSAMRRAAILVRPDLANAPAEPPPQQQELLDGLVIYQAVRFAAASRKVSEAKVWVGGDRDGEMARSYAMALAAIVGEVSPTAIARVFGCTRQNVQNCTVRYLRARDGDDDDDRDGDGRVIERGRLRQAKSGDPALGRDEALFLAILTAGSAL